MGDRALVVFVDKGIEDGKPYFLVSPTAYLHWAGERVPGLLEEHRELMGERKSDVDYALARFIGIAHSKCPNYNTSLGCFETPKYVKEAIKKLMSGRDMPVKAPTCVGVWPNQKVVNQPMLPVAALEEYSHGDAGVIVVDTRDFSWNAYGGYLADPATVAEIMNETTD